MPYPVRLSLFRNARLAQGPTRRRLDRRDHAVPPRRTSVHPACGPRAHPSTALRGRMEDVPGGARGIRLPPIHPDGSRAHGWLDLRALPVGNPRGIAPCLAERGTPRLRRGRHRAHDVLQVRPELPPGGGDEAQPGRPPPAARPSPPHGPISGRSPRATKDMATRDGRTSATRSESRTTSSTSTGI